MFERSLKSLLAAVSILAFCPFALAQPAVGTTISEALKLSSGRSVPLPPGAWRIVHHEAENPVKPQLQSFQVVVLRTLNPDSRVSMLIVRTSEGPRKWNPLLCAQDKNAVTFMHNLHGTSLTQLVSKCSMTLELGQLGGWVDSRMREPDTSTWWKPVLPAFTQIAELLDRQTLMNYVEISEFNGPAVSIQAFVIAPPRTNGKTFRAAYVAGERNSYHEVQEAWNRQYVEATEQAFLRKAKAKIGDVNFEVPFRAPRKALVVGNDEYVQIPRLSTAMADTRSVAQTLESVGFKVTHHTNLAEKGLKEAWSQFVAQVSAGDDVVVYLAGQAVQVSGPTNFLLPVDIYATTESEIAARGLSLQKMLDDLHTKELRLALTVVDASHGNPFKARGVKLGEQGLAAVAARQGQMVMLSADWGQESPSGPDASDPQRRSAFARAFLHEIAKIGVPVDLNLRNLRAEVSRQAQAAGREQTPAIAEQAIGTFYFRP